MALRNSTVDVFLAALSQLEGKRSGVIGRLEDIVNGVVTHYDPGQGRPRRAKVQQRNGFRTLATTGHSSTTGVTETVAWSNPELLTTLGSELLSIANAVPRVWDGTDWTHYAEERVVSNRLSQEVFHTSQHTLQAPDSAWIDGVTCSTWVETLGGEDPSVQVFVGFRSDDGTWVRVPTLIYNPGVPYDEYASMARVVADADELHFWVVLNASLDAPDPNTPVFLVILYDLNGRELDRDFSVGQIWDEYPGYWDIRAANLGGVRLAQPLNTAAAAADGVRFSGYTHVAGVISVLSSDNADIHCRGPLAWLTNDFDDEAYLATIGLGEESGGRLWGYQMTALATVGHEYNFQVQPQGWTDSLIGFVQEAAADEPTLFVSFTVLRSEAATVGPPFDPQLRYSQCYSCDWDDNVTFIRQNDFTCQVSRAFLHDDEYYSFNYYQGGSGKTLATQTVESVTFTAGDYMTGAAIQPLTVRAGDYTTGSPKSFLSDGGVSISTRDSQASFAITPVDTVEFYLISTGDSLIIPVGTLVLKWTFATLSIESINVSGSRLFVDGSSIPSADGEWDIYQGGNIIAPFTSNVVYTSTTSVAGGTLTAPGTFGASGDAEVLAMTYYGMPLETAYSAETAAFLVGGDMVVTGNPTGANNGTKAMERALVGPGFNYLTFGLGTGIWIETGSEISSNGGFAADVSPDVTNAWAFTGETFSDVDDGWTMTVSGSEFLLNGSPVSNDNDYTITDVPVVGIAVTSGEWLAQIMAAPLPEMSLSAPPDVQPYSFFLQDISPDYSYIDAILIVSNDTVRPENNGSYRIVDFDPDPLNHLLYAVPADGNTGQRNQSFIADDQQISIVFATSVQSSFQPCWLMVPLTGTKPVTGRFEYGLAYSDWRYEASATPPPPTNQPNLFPLHVTSPVRAADAWKFVLPYRAISFTVGQTLVTANGQAVNAAVASSESTVGTKQFALSDDPGLAFSVAGAQVLPGPMCGEFTASGFNENGINFGFEAPFQVTQIEDSGVALREGGTYQYIVVGELTDENGDRVFSIPSPPLQVTLSGDNNIVQIGGRMIQPFSVLGVPLTSGHWGVTNHKLVGISVYRTSYQDGVPTTQHYKITQDLNVNGLAPVSATNSSGFSFPDEFTWYYRDANLDAAVISQEILYTDKGYLPRFPAPAQRGGAFWKNRSWVIGYDGAVWMSGEKKEGDAIWFFPAFRYVLPTTDKPVALAAMDDYLVVFCAKSIWYIPAATFPDATGRNGALPTPVELPFTNGCTGFAVTMKDGVAYSSTAGGVWFITRALANVWLSHPVQDTLAGLTVTGMEVDAKQRLHVATGTQVWMVYDQVVQEWYRWAPATNNAILPAVLDGEVCFQGLSAVWLYDPSIFYDDVATVVVPVALDVTIAAMNFGNVRGLKAVWEMQIVGEYKAPHNLNAVLSYPDDDPDNPTVFPAPEDAPYTPDPDAPYLMAINPMIEQAASYGLRVFADFEGITEPGDSFELELIGCEVGLDSTSGIDKRPDSSRIPGS